MSTLDRKPSNLDDIVFENPHVEKRVRQYASNQRTGNLIFFGPPGTGKSTISKIITEDRRRLSDGENEAYVFFGSDISEKTIEQLPVYWQVTRFGGTREPYVIIEEADQLTPKLQRHLRTILDRYDNGHVIMTTNHIHSIDPPLVDRCDQIEMPAIKSDQWRTRLADLVAKEGLEISEGTLNTIIETCTGSARDLLRGIEDYIVDRKSLYRIK